VDKMANANILDAIERLNFALKKVEEFENLELPSKKRILENRTITLEGYLRYFETDGIPKMKKILNFLEDDYND
jgi:hypothetical protein